MTSPFHNASRLSLIHCIPGRGMGGEGKENPPNSMIPTCSRATCPFSHQSTPQACSCRCVFLRLTTKPPVSKHCTRPKNQKVAKSPAAADRQTHTKRKMKEDNLHPVHVSHFIIPQTILSQSRRWHLKAGYAPMAVFIF